MTNKHAVVYRTCTGAHFVYGGIFSVLGNATMSPVHFSSSSLVAICPDPSVADKLIAEENVAELVACVNQLPSFLREVVYLHYFKQLTIAEIAVLTGRHPRIVSTWILHALRWLKILLAKPKPPD
jgi:DNA-directed RNA polymerase specialized sigma24 family protein